VWLHNCILDPIDFTHFNAQTNCLGYRFLMRWHVNTQNTHILMVVKLSVWLYNYILDHIDFINFGPQKNRLEYRFFMWQHVNTLNTHTLMVSKGSVWLYNCIQDHIVFVHLVPRTIFKDKGFSCDGVWIHATKLVCDYKTVFWIILFFFYFSHQTNHLGY
jgi:hypothetical protein